MNPSRFVNWRPSRVVSRALAVFLVALWGVLRLWVFGDFIFPLTYALPLLIGIWTRDIAAVWWMALTFAAMHTAQALWILSPGAASGLQTVATFAATLVNIGVGAGVVHAIIRLRLALEQRMEEVAAQSEELQAQSEEIAHQNEELALQNEEVTQQAEELSSQNEELQRQSEDIQAFCEDLERREALVQRLIATATSAVGDDAALERIVDSALPMFGPHASAVIVYERAPEGLVPRAAKSTRHLAAAPSVQPADSFIELVIAENRTASLNDGALRPDLPLPRYGDTVFRSVLCVPVHEPNGTTGAIAICAEEPHDWTDEQFRLAEWLATQCWNVGQLLRAHAQLARQAALIDLAPTAILVRRPDGEITFWSKGAEALYGWTAAEALGRTIHELLHTSFPRPVQEIEAEFHREAHWSGELVQLTRQGHRVVVESRWRIERQSAGTPTAILEAHVDVTARRLAEEGLRDSDRRKNEFIATLSHELRNPLTPIRYALGLLEGVQHPALDAPWAVIDRQLRHMVRLVDDLLDITRIANNKIQLQLSRVDVAVVLDQALEAVRPEIDRLAHTCNVTAPRESFWAEADAERFAQVLTNLLNNAARYTPRGGTIGVSVARRDGAIEVAVRDSGIGLRADDLGRVFDMFSQVGHAGSGGLGIGLALVKGVMELHGGTVRAVSDGLGQGSTFVVTLPALEPPFETAPAAVRPAVRLGEPRRILVVEDNADGAEMMQAILQLDGHAVHVACDGGSALAALEQFSPEIAFLDIGLPDMSGYELARRLREHPAAASTVLVAVTGWGQDGDRTRARDAGFATHLVKPADPSQIRQIVSSAFGPAKSARPSDSTTT